MASVILKPYERRREPGPISRFALGALLTLVATIYGVGVVVLPPQMMSYLATPLFILIAMSLWMMPDIGGIALDTMQKLMIAYIALFIVWPSYIAFNLPGLPWISVTRIALFMMASVFIWNFSTSQEMRDRLRDAVSETPISIRVFWIFWATTTLSLAFSTKIGFSVSKYINNQLYWTMALFLSAMLATRAGFVSKVSRVLVVSTIIVLMYSLYEYRVERVIWIDYLPSFLKIDPELLETLMKAQNRAGTDFYRVRGPFAAALYFSESLTMAFPFFLHFTAKARNPLAFMALAAATFACMSVMFFTNARSAMIGMILGVFLYVLYGAIRTRNISPRSIGGTGVLLAYPAMAVAVALIVWFWHRAHVLVLGGGQHQASTDARAVQWGMFWPKVATHPFGYGVARGNDALGFYNAAGVGTVDSYFITIMMDSGLLALPAFMLTFLIPAWVAFSYYRTAKTPEEELLAPLSLALINFCIIKSVLTSEASVPLAFVMVGCIIGIVWQRKRADAAAQVAKPAAARPLPRTTLATIARRGT